MTQNPNRSGLGSLIGNPIPQAGQGGEDDDYAAAQARKAAKGSKGTPEQTADTVTGGGLARRGAPAMLPRKRRERVVRDKLTTQVSVGVLDALADLVDRDQTNRYDEVEEALRAHLISKGIEIVDD